MISSGIFLSAAFILLRLFTNNKPNMTAINKMHRSRRATVTPAATGAATAIGAAVVVGTGAAVVVGTGAAAVVVGTRAPVVIVVGTVAKRKYSGVLALCDYFINIYSDIFV